jgi:rod shape determining protein RodA
LDRRLLRNFDFALFLAAVAIVIFGCTMIYSASKGGRSGTSYVERQLVWAVIGLVAGAVVASVDYGILQRISGKLYAINLVMLVAVLIAGASSKGAQRWIGYGAIRIQPSEFAKIILIIALATFVVRRMEKIRTFETFALSFLYLSVPMLLIFKQPDLGTSLVLLAVWLSMLFVMGTDIKNVLIFAAACAILGFAVFHVHGVLKEYQKNRLVSFVDPMADPRGSGYHVTQSRIAIGSGQLVGKGFLGGTQRELRFIPEQHTDFIFTVVGEELGFVGSVTLLLLYFVLVWRGLHIMSATEDAIARAIAAGVVGMFLFHIVVNMGMTLGIMPVTGVPLPMFSYGGSSLMANLMAIGLLEGISMRRHRIAF